MTVKAVIFDLHGTIVEYKVNSKAARAEVIEYLISQGIPQAFFSPNESYFEAINKLEEYMRDKPIEGKDYHQLRDNVFGILDKYEMEYIGSTRLIPGMLETLQTLKKRGLKLGLLTVNGQKATDQLFSKFRLEGYFQAVITRESAPRFKPNPLHLDALLKMLKVSPEEAIVVGDSTSDMKVAHALKALAVGVLGGFSQKDELVQAGADYLSKTPADLIALIEKLC